MADLLGLATKEITRKEILKLCQEAGEVGCSKEVLNAALGKLGIKSKDLDMEIHYLQEKGLLHVQLIENERLNIRRKVVQITASGMDYLDGVGEDIPGIGV